MMSAAAMGFFLLETQDCYKKAVVNEPSNDRAIEVLL